MTNPFVATYPDDAVWINGVWTTRDNAKLPVDDLGLRQAVIAVERLRCYGEQWWQVSGHQHRLNQTLETFGLPSSIADEAFEVLNGLVNRQPTRECRTEDSNFSWGATILVTPGDPSSDWGLGDDRRHAAATRVILPHRICDSAVQKRQQFGQPLRITNVEQPSGMSWPRWIKTRCRLHYFLADQRARAEQAGAAGVLLDEDGTITETSTSNIAIVESGGIVTPPDQRILPGVTQSVVKRLAMADSIDWICEPISPGRLREADEVLLMGTDCGVWFASEVDGRKIGGGEPGPLFEHLRKRWDAATR